MYINIITIAPNAKEGQLHPDCSETLFWEFTCWDRRFCWSLARCLRKEHGLAPIGRSLISIPWKEDRFW